MSSTTLEVVSVTGSRCEASADSPSAAATEVSASSTGTAAASSAPNATTRIASVTGRLSTSAWWKSSPYVFCERLLDRAAADLFDPQVRMGGLDGGGRVDQRLHPVDGVLRIAGHLGPDQHGRATGRRHRLGHGGDLGQGAQPTAGLGPPPRSPRPGPADRTGR